MPPFTDRSRTRVRIRRLHEDDGRADVAELTPSARLAMMWQLARDAWAFKGEPQHAESRLQRHVVRVRRGRG
jgi:hypothetical protein